MELSGSPSQSPKLPKRKKTAAASPPKRERSEQVEKRLGRYAITGQLGQGGMGIVYEATDTLLQRRVAIKLLPKEVSANPEALARFLREAQGAARLNHANVVAVYDIGEAQGTHYIVMELIKGGNAQDILRSRGPFHWLEATTILMDVCRGVAAAHQAGLIHRDIKPSNILRSTEGVVKLGDFGLVKPAGIKGTEVTALGEIVGTPHYMSPEQSRCDALDERSDIYSLGATYFALLTGRPPFNAPDSMQVLFAHCAHPVPDPREIVRKIPKRCTEIIRKAMAKTRSERYANTSELLAELEEVLLQKPSNSGAETDFHRPPQFVWGRANPTETTNPLSLAEAYPGERTGAVGTNHRRWMRRGIGVLFLFAVALLALFLLNDRNKPEPTLIAQIDWPSLDTEADKAIRSRNPTAMKKVIDRIQVFQKREQSQAPVRLEEIRQTVARLEKALAFRESITEKGLVRALDGQASGALFSPDDRWLAFSQTHGDAGAFILDSYTGEKCYTLWPRRGDVMVRVQSLAFSHDSQVVAAACSDNTIKISHFVTGKTSSLELGPDVNRPLAVTFSPIKRELVVGSDPFGEGKGEPYLRIWNIDTGREPFLFKAEHSARVSSVAYCTGGHQVATGSHDKRVVMWNAETGRIWRELRTGMIIKAIACDPQGRTIVVGGQNEETPVLQFWDYAAESLLATRSSPHGTCRCVAFSRNGTLLASGSGSRILIWNPETHTLLATLTGHRWDVTSLAFSAEGGILVSGSVDQTFRLWDVTRYLCPVLEP